MREPSEDKKTTEFGFAIFIYVLLILSMAPAGVLFWLSELGIETIKFRNADGDLLYLKIMGAFLSIVLIALVYSAKSKDLFYKLTLILLGVAVLNMSGCVGIWNKYG